MADVARDAVIPLERRCGHSRRRNGKTDRIPDPWIDIRRLNGDGGGDGQLNRCGLAVSGAGAIRRPRPVGSGIGEWAAHKGLRRGSGDPPPRISAQSFISLQIRFLTSAHGQSDALTGKHGPASGLQFNRRPDLGGAEKAPRSPIAMILPLPLNRRRIALEPKVPSSTTQFSLSDEVNKSGPQAIAKTH